MSAALRFLGHACFELRLPSGRRVVVDPFEADSFGGRIALQPLEDHFDLAVSTHAHHDHAAFDAVPSARVVAAPYRDNELSVTATAAAHDEFGGRLRGGTVQLLRVQVAECTVIFCGDLGERPTGTLLDWLVTSRPDILVLPVGGYFTLGPDAAAELASMVAPRVVVPCHAREHGARFEELGSAALFAARFADVETLDQLSLPPARIASRAPAVVELRPHHLRA